MCRHLGTGILREEAYELCAHPVLGHCRHDAQKSLPLLDGEHVAYRLDHGREGRQRFLHRRYELLVLQDFGNVGLGQSEDHRTISYYAKSTLGMEDHVRVWHDSDEPITAGYVRSLGEAVKVTPPAKWRFCGCRRETFGTDQCFTCSSARIGDSRRKTPDLFAYLG